MAAWATRLALNQPVTGKPLLGFYPFIWGGGGPTRQDLPSHYWADRIYVDYDALGLAGIDVGVIFAPVSGKRA